MDLGNGETMPKIIRVSYELDNGWLVNFNRQADGWHILARRKHHKENWTWTPKEGDSSPSARLALSLVRTALLWDDSHPDPDGRLGRHEKSEITTNTPGNHERKAKR